MITETLKLFDFERTNVLLEGFNKSTGFVTAILDLEGNILSQSGWRKICVDFHRANAKTATNCFVSDTFLMEKINSSEKYRFYKCLNGLVDVRLPIIVRGEHIANLFSGQFLFEEPDIAYFRNQAHIYGFDEDEYLEALSKVPVLSIEKVQTAMDFLQYITQLIIEITADRMDLLEINETIRKSESALNENQILLKQNMKDLVESQKIAHIGTWRLDINTNKVTWTEELYRMYGFDPTIPPPPYTEHMKLFTPESWERLSSALEKTSTSGIPYELELETVTSDGGNGWMWVRGEAEMDSEGRIVSLWGAAQDITEYKRIEVKTKQSEEKFQILFNQAPLGYQSLDFEGRFIEVNQKWLDTLGYRKDEVIGKWFGDFLCPEYVDGFRKRFPLFKSQGFIQSEFEMLCKNGKRLTISFEGKIGYGAHGEFKQTHCILKDITDQRKAEKALSDSEERYRYLFDNAGVGVSYYTLDGIIISLNRKTLEFYGGRIENYIGKSVNDIFQAEDAKKFFMRVSLLISSEQALIYEDVIVTNSGIKWISCTMTKVMNAAAEIMGVQIIMSDISERKKIENELKRIMNHTQRILDNLQDAFIQTDLTRKVVVANAQTIQMFGYSYEALIGQTIDMFFVDSEAWLKMVDVLFKKGSVADKVIQMRRKDDSAFWASLNIQFIRDDKDKIVGIEGLVRDVTERITLQDEVKLQRDNLIKSNEQLEHLFKQSIMSISKIAELRDAYTAGHQRRVGELACAIAKRMGLSDEVLLNLSYGALIHDIGKIYVPAEILNKPGKISNIEFQMLQSHVELGYNIVKEIDFSEVIAKMVYQHHERLDGSGYPQGLVGDQIITESRILIVSDVVEAMTSHRPYRAALGIDAALSEILKFRGQKYDCEVVDVCTQLFRENAFSFSIAS